MVGLMRLNGLYNICVLFTMVSCGLIRFIDVGLRSHSPSVDVSCDVAVSLPIDEVDSNILCLLI